MAASPDIGTTFRSSMSLAGMQLACVASYGASAVTAAAANNGNPCGFDSIALDDLTRLREFLDAAEVALRALSARRAA